MIPAGAPVTLTLIDLPGLIANTERAEDAADIKLVEQLTTDYIAKKNAIIVTVITCQSEMETQVKTNNYLLILPLALSQPGELYFVV